MEVMISSNTQVVTYDRDYNPVCDLSDLDTHSCDITFWYEA